MSGGHFYNNNLSMNLEQLENELRWQGGVYSEATQQALRECLKTLRKAQVCLHRVDYLFSGDSSEESFLNNLKKELKEVEEKPIEEFGKPCCENCKYNGKKQIRYKQSYYFRENEHNDYVETGCEKTEEYWPNNGEHCCGFKHVEDWD